MANNQSKPLAVLLVEDQPDDAELLLLELRRAGYEPRSRRVDTQADYLAALEAGYAPGKPWDLVLSDYSLPGFNEVHALTLLKQRGSDIPFILVSGTVGEEFAVEAMKWGATDYLVKGRLARLKSAVSHALEENRLRLETRAAERARRASEQRVRALIENSADGIGVVRQDGRLSYVSPASLSLLGFTPDQLLGRDPFEFVHPDDLARVRAVIRDVVRAPGLPREIEYRLRHADGSWRTIRTSITNLLAEPSVGGVVFNFRDVTAQRQDEQALDIPYNHHERWDGTGYTRQLKGEAIPIAARVFAVVDTWDVMLADRPYRRACSREQALAYLRQQAGGHFDPRVVEEFMGMMEDTHTCPNA